MSNGPLPTTLVFLSELPAIPQHTKVRFLGCVTKYTTSTATVALQHLTSKDTVTALVDVRLLVESLKTTDTEVGAWMNVIGYVDTVSSEKSNTHTNANRGESTVEVTIHAVMMWSAGAIAIAEYESALLRRKLVT